MHKDESINSMSERFASLTNELRNLGKTFETEHLLWKILILITHRWDSKVTSIGDSKDVSKYTYEELIGSLMAHELFLNRREGEPVKSKGIALNAVKEDSENEIDDQLSLSLRNLRMIGRKGRRSFFQKPSLKINHHKERAISVVRWDMWSSIVQHGRT